MAPASRPGRGRGSVIASARRGGAATKLQIRQPTELANIVAYLKSKQLPADLQPTSARAKRYKFIRKAANFRLKTDATDGADKLYLRREDGTEVPMVMTDPDLRHTGRCRLHSRSRRSRSM